MTQRKSLTKKVRFEVFKRDSFICQYCGSKAPDVILEVDHLNPVKEGGSNDIMNLVTSCFSCNRGKGARTLSDKTVVEKQREQIKELNIRRQQLQMMLEWRDELRTIEEDEAQKAVDYWDDKISVYDMYLNDVGYGIVRKLVKKHGVLQVLDAMDISADKYIDCAESANGALNKVGGILYLRNAPDHTKAMSYIKGICRNKFNYFDNKRASISLNIYYQSGGDLDELKENLISGRIRNWAHFISYLKD